MFHIHCKKGDVGRYCILPGDPGRVESIAAYFDDAKQIAYNREFNVWTGYLLGEKVTACSTGIGGPSASIAVEACVRIWTNSSLWHSSCLHMKPWTVISSRPQWNLKHLRLKSSRRLPKKRHAAAVRQTKSANAAIARRPKERRLSKWRRSKCRALIQTSNPLWIRKRPRMNKQSNRTEFFGAVFVKLDFMQLFLWTIIPRNYIAR